MSNVQHAANRTPKQQATFENRREREFYRYYEPIRQLSEHGPAYCDLHSNAAVAAHRAVSSPDRALTAFCQLGALRLRTRRAMLFFFDSNYAYILAEATQTLSLEDASEHDIEDHLWLGHTVIPRGFSVCEHTANLPANQGSNRFDDNSTFAHIVNDLTDDARFCDQPYVSDGPKARFYAGVPITTPNGINIGAYCVLDDVKRDGIREKDVAFLREMSATIMMHLEMVRAKAEHQRATQMIDGLGDFMRGAPGFCSSVVRTSWLGSERQSALAYGQQQQQQQRPALTRHSAVAALDSDIAIDRRRSSAREILAGDTTPPLLSRDSHSTVTDSMSINGASQTKPDAHRERLIPTETHAMFERAAEITQKAVGLDGVVFLDASIGAFAGLVNSAEKNDTDFSSDTAASSRDPSVSDYDDLSLAAGDDTVNQQAPCAILGSSYAQSSGETGEDKPTTNLTAKLLRSFLRRYPNGKVWNFGDDGSTSDDEPSPSGYESEAALQSPGPFGKAISDDLYRATRRRQRHLEENRALQLLFPRARGLILTGMRDPNTGRWFAGCFIWTYSPIRILSDEGEGAYMAAICDLIMQEMSRIDARRSERAKSDFISSISHELRSPLHGILGSAECLQEEGQRLDEFCQGLIEKIEVCGRTLLDIIDHLLDFSEISRHVQISGGSFNGALSQRRSRPVARRTPTGSMMSLEADIALDRITEEVVETAVYSYLCSRDKQQLRGRHVDVLVDIDYSTNENWHCRLPTGAWKRICINLVNNALKYTDEGYILVTLAAVPIPNRRRRFNCVLTVADTGRGMSKDFLENVLFQPFTQEDSLVEGTGLGISLISKIIKNLGGRIDVHSEKGVGTKVIVTVPTERSRLGQEEATHQTQPQVPKTFSGLRVGIVDSEQPHQMRDSKDLGSTAKGLLLASMRKTCTHLGLEPQSLSSDGCENIDICLISQADVAHINSMDHEGPSKKKNANSMSLVDKPLVVLCDDVSSKREMIASQSARWLSSHAVYISQPCGPQKLCKAIQACLERKQLLLNGLDPLNGSGDNPTSLTTNGNANHVAREPSATSLPLLTRVNPAPDSGISLLLVDDNPINLQLLVTYATKHKHNKLTAANGLEAVEKYVSASPTKPRFILMDINMPVMNGFEATRQIRQFEKQNGLIPATVIALTGLGSDDAKNEAFISGVNLFLTKPVKLKELTRIIRTSSNG